MPKFINRKRRLHLCGFNGCRAVVDGPGRCAEHSARQFLSDRRQASRDFLNSTAWQRLRKLKLQQQPECEICSRRKSQPVPATDVDHILPRHTHPELSLTLSNLQSLCRPCHSRKTATEQ
jgi:5-methylcytosine-specific restriction enzyme A